MEEIEKLKAKISELEAKVESLESQKDYLNFIPTNVFVIDQNLCIDYLNSHATEVFGLNIDQVKGTNFLDLFTKDDHSLLSELFNSLPSDKILTTETKIVNTDGRVQDVEVLFKRKISTAEFLVIVRDTSLRNKRRKALEQEKELLSALMDNFPDTIYFKDTESKFTRVNKSQADMLGLANCEEAIGKTDHDFFPKEHADSALVDEKRIIDSRTPLIAKREKLNHPGVKDKWVTATKIPITNKDGEISGIVGISRDISELKIAEDKVNEYTKELQYLNQSKDKFFSIIAHDLKNPFNSLLGFSELLMKNKSEFTEEEIDDLIKRIYNSSKNTYQLLENLLQWSRSQTGRIDFQPTEFDLLVVVNECLALLLNEAHRKSIRIESNIKDEQTVYADFNMVETILRNLITNAIKFSAEGGFIKLESQKVDDKLLAVSITDNGVGIPDGISENIFKIDSHHSTLGTNNESGTGLGLILCKEFVEKNGGTITVESKEGEGSKFTFTLPAL